MSTIRIGTGAVRVIVGEHHPIMRRDVDQLAFTLSVPLALLRRQREIVGGIEGTERGACRQRVADLGDAGSVVDAGIRGSFGGDAVDGDGAPVESTPNFQCQKLVRT